MNKPKIVLIGAGGHARSCIDVIEQEDKFSIAGLIGSRDELGTRVLEYKVIATNDDIKKISQDIRFALIAVGQIRTAQVRVSLFEEASAAGFEFPCIISPKSHVSRFASVGDGTIVMHGATINSNAHIGKNCIINSHALIEHDSQIRDHSHISTGAIINGGVVVGSHSFIGSRSVIREGIQLGDQSMVSIGSVVARWPSGQDTTSENMTK